MTHGSYFGFWATYGPKLPPKNAKMFFSLPESMNNKKKHVGNNYYIRAYKCIHTSPVYYSCEDSEEPGTPHGSPVKMTPPKSPMKISPGKRRSRTASTSAPSENTVVRSGSRTIYTAGRPPWYDSHGQLKDAFVIGQTIVTINHNEIKNTLSVLLLTIEKFVLKF